MLKANSNAEDEKKADVSKNTIVTKYSDIENTGMVYAYIKRKSICI